MTALAAPPALDAPPHERRPNTAVTVAVALCAPGQPRLLTTRLAEVIARHTTVAHWWSARIDAQLGPPGIAHATGNDPLAVRLEQHLDQVRAGAGFLLLEVDRGDTVWTRRVLAHTERLLLVTEPEPTPADEAHIRALLAARRPDTEVWLAVLQPPGIALPRGTAALAERCGAHEVLHLRDGIDADVARAARLLSGHGVGLVLGGGGGRGCAHLGVYRALCELGVPVDRVAGASMGGVLACMLALEDDWQRAIDAIASDFRNLLDYTFPATSLLRGERIARAIAHRLDGVGFEDLLRPLDVVVTNLTRSTSEVRRRGDLLHVLRSTIAIPGVLPPVPDGEDLLVDGGVLDNLPIGVLRGAASVSTVIAVDVTPLTGPRAKVDYGLSASGWRALGSRVIPGRAAYPSLTTVLMASLLTAAQRERNRLVVAGTADLLVRLDLRGIGLLEFERVAEAARLGYEAALPQVQAWLDARA